MTPLKIAVAAYFAHIDADCARRGYLGPRTNKKVTAHEYHMRMRRAFNCGDDVELQAATQSYSDWVNRVQASNDERRIANGRTLERFYTPAEQRARDLFAEVQRVLKIVHQPDTLVVTQAMGEWLRVHHPNLHYVVAKPFPLTK